MVTKKDDEFQQYLSKFQNLVVQSQAGDILKVLRLFAEGLDIQIATMIYSMEKVPDVTISFLSHVFFLISVVQHPYFSFAPSYQETDWYLLAFLSYSSPLVLPL